MLLTVLAFVLTSPAFHVGARIPVKYTCDGTNVSPELHWTAPPKGTRSFTLKVVDVDAPGGKLVHWTAAGIPASARGLRSGQHAPKEGLNGAGTRGYTGPCPPPGLPHRYFFTLTAIGAHGKPIAHATLIGKYQRG